MWREALTNNRFITRWADTKRRPHPSLRRIVIMSVSALQQLDIEADAMVMSPDACTWLSYCFC